MKKTFLSYDFRHTAYNQLWRLVSGPLLLILVPLYLSPEVQGYWYTFMSLAALAIFADMGFSSILLQFSAHEFAYLKFESKKKLIGEKQHLERLSTLLIFAMKWSFGMGIIAFPIILSVGFMMLAEKQTLISWMIPWTIYGLASVFVFMNSMILSFIEGCNSVGEVQKIRFVISFFTTISTGLFLVLGFELYALAISLLIGALSGMGIILYRYQYMLKQLYDLSLNVSHAWKNEILPLTGKYAISWISGYFIFSIFTPIAFHYYGAIEAGKVGLSMAVCSAIFGIANMWITIIVPKINMFIARKDYQILDPIFRRHLLLAIVTYIFGTVVLFSIILLFGQYLSFSERLVSLLSLSMIAVGWLLQIIVNSYAVYMRAHKEEPLVILSFVSGIYIALTTCLIALYLPSEYLFIGFLSSYIWVVPWVLILFGKYKGKKIGS